MLHQVKLYQETIGNTTEFIRPLSLSYLVFTVRILSTCRFDSYFVKNLTMNQTILLMYSLLYTSINLMILNFIFQVPRRLQWTKMREQGRIKQEQYVSPPLYMQIGPLDLLLLLASVAPAQNPPCSNFEFKFQLSAFRWEWNEKRIIN